MNWFCCQPLSSAVFPLFFLSKETENLIYKSLSSRGTCGFFGISAAVRFMHPSSSTLGGQNSFKSISRGGTSHEFAPEMRILYWQIELDEDEGISILSATVAWSDSPLSTFENSIHSYELSLYQVARDHL